MRRTYELSAETIKVLNGSATKVAEEFGCDPAYIHQILGQTATDPFAKFEWLFSSAVKAGCDVGPWMVRLETILAKYRGSAPRCVQTETSKFVKESADVPMAHIDDRPLYDRLSEVTQAITQGEVLKAALIDAINAEKEQENGLRTRYGSKPVSTEARRTVSNLESVKARRAG